MFKRNRWWVVGSVLMAGASLYMFWSLDEPSGGTLRSELEIPDQQSLQGNDAGQGEAKVLTSEVVKQAEQEEVVTSSLRAQVIALTAEEYVSRSAFGALPGTLTGTDIPNLYLDGAGNLVVDESVRDVIEYFLIAARHEGNEQVLARLQEYLSMALEGPAQMQALTVLEQYLRYRDQLDAVVDRDQIVGDQTAQMTALKETLERRKTLRRDVLGEQVAQAMFGNSEKYEDYAVGLMQVQLQENLTPAERDSMIVALEEQLPEQMRQRARYEREARNVDARIALLHEQGGKEAEIYALREAFYGEEVARKMAFMEERSDDWQARVEAFRLNEQQILASVTLTEQQKRQQINQLRDQEFTEDEKMKMARQSLP